MSFRMKKPLIRELFLFGYVLKQNSQRLIMYVVLLTKTDRSQ